MNYREPPKEREMRLSLTRGEVNKIVLDHLRKAGKLPDAAKVGATTMPALDEKFGGGYLGTEKDEDKKKWEDWICLMITWKEQGDQ